MQLKILILFLSFSVFVFAQSTDKNQCSGYYTSQILKDLTNFEIIIRNGNISDDKLELLNAHLKKMESEANSKFPQIKTDVEKAAKEHLENIMIDFNDRSRNLKKSIAENPVTKSTYDSLQELTSSYNSTSKSMYVIPSPIPESSYQAEVRKYVGFYAHRLFTEKSIKAVSDLTEDVVKKCVPKEMLEEVTIADTKYRALYCIEANEAESKVLEKTNGANAKDECRAYTSCGLKTLKNNPNTQFFSVTITSTCKKKNNVCPNYAECYIEADNRIYKPGSPDTTAPKEGARR